MEYGAVTYQLQNGFIPFPEKAILDLFYFQRGAATLEGIRAMRFQNLDGLDPDRLLAFAQRAGVAKLRESVTRFLDYRAEFLREYGLT